MVSMVLKICLGLGVYLCCFVTLTVVGYGTFLKLRYNADEAARRWQSQEDRVIKVLEIIFNALKRKEDNLPAKE